MTDETPDGRVVVPTHGEYGAGELPALLQTLVRQLTDGRLDLDVGGARRSLWVEAGQMRAVVSGREDEKLGRWLVDRGLLESARMALALLQQPEGVLFGTTLVEQDLIAAERLEEELEALAVTIVGRCLFDAGSYAFAENERVPFEAATLNMTSASLLVAAVRSLGEEHDFESMVDDEEFVCLVDDAVLRHQRAELTTHEAFVLSRVDGTTTVKQLTRVAGLPRARVLQALVGLATAGLVEMRALAASTPEPRVDVSTVVPQAEETNGSEFTSLQQREYEEIVRLARECRTRDYYRRLGVSPGATYDQIHVKFRDLSELYHPDRAVESHLRPLRRELADINTCLQEAYAVLIHPAKRQRYDALLKDQGDQAAERLRREESRATESDERQVGKDALSQAEELVRAGDVGAAVQLLDQTVRYRPEPRALLLLARLEFRNPLWTQRGLDHLRRAITVDPRFTEGWLELATFWEKKGQAGKQRQCLERILKYDSDNAEARKKLGAIRS